MSKKNSKPAVSKQATALLIILAAAIVVVAVKYFKDNPDALGQKSASARVAGNPKAAINIIEYIDFECPACAAGAKELKTIMEKNSDKIYLEMRYYPLGMHKHSMQAARYAQCAAQQKKFWPYQDLLISRQAAWSALENADPAFNDMARELQLDMKSLEVCLQDEKTNETILQEKAGGASLGIQSTPTYFINGKMVVGVKSLKDELAPKLGLTPEGVKN
jgi:protein-disulfide isomerase